MVGSIDEGVWEGIKYVACDSLHAKKIKDLLGLFVITYKTGSQREYFCLNIEIQK